MWSINWWSNIYYFSERNTYLSIDGVIFYYLLIYLFWMNYKDQII